MAYLLREEYLNKLIGLSKTQDIKVITGIRRCGKSVLLELYKDYLKEHEDHLNIVFINLTELENDQLLEYHALHDYIMRHYKEGMYNVLMIDEVQMCLKFELAINSIHSKNIFDIYITGSNAFLLSSDLATLFTGRVMEIKVFPFSYKEYLQYLNLNSQGDYLDDYVLYGGLPGTYAYQDDVLKKEYIQELYSTILIRDLVEKYHIKNVKDFNAVTEYLMDNIGNIVSSNNITNALNNNGASISRKTLFNYIQYLKSAFMFYEIKRYDLKGKKYLESLTKIYLCDTGIRYAINGKRNIDYGYAYENIVYIELLRRGYEVYIGKLYQKEIDFVVIHGNTKIYIQVSDNITGQNTFEREIAPLKQIKDNYQKILIARTRHPVYDYEGIVIMDIVEWLLNKE